MMKNAQVPILGFAAFSGTGKTTLITQLIPLLNQQGVRVGLIKHSHHNFDIDHPNKDSYKLRMAGASPVMLVSSHRRAIITEFQQIKEPQLDEELQFFEQTYLDLILVEGFKAERFPKIELHRSSLNKPLIFPNDTHIIAIASDERICNDGFVPTQLDINNPKQITEFIMRQFLGMNP